MRAELNNKIDILILVKKIGIHKDYKEWTDWYGGISKKDLPIVGITEHSIKKYFITYNNVIRELFPEKFFREWLFKVTSHGWWEKIENRIEYLKWLEFEMGWSKPDDWYNINNQIFNSKNGRVLLRHYKLHEIPMLLYPNYKFILPRFKGCHTNYYDNYENLKNIIHNLSYEKGRMLTYKELDYHSLRQHIKKHGTLKNITRGLELKNIKSYETLSGNLVNSMFEVIFSNFLYLNNINFKYNQKIDTYSNYRFDFKINGFYIEIWGFYGNKYSQVKKDKQKYYFDKNLKLIEIPKRNIYKKY